MNCNQKQFVWLKIFTKVISGIWKTGIVCHYEGSLTVLSINIVLSGWRYIIIVIASYHSTMQHNFSCNILLTTFREQFQPTRQWVTWLGQEGKNHTNTSGS